MAGLFKRGKIYYAVYYVGGKERRKSLGTTSYQVAKTKLRKLESSIDSGKENQQPTKTPLPDIVSAYIDHMRTIKTKNGLRVDLLVSSGYFRAPLSGSGSERGIAVIIQQEAKEAEEDPCAGGRVS